MNFQEENATAILEVISSNASYFLFEETSRIKYGQWNIYSTTVKKLKAHEILESKRLEVKIKVKLCFQILCVPLPTHKYFTLSSEL